MTTQNNSTDSRFLSTGIPGMDAVLNGGLTRDRLYLVEGEPGTGKTTMALHFLAEGARLGESVVYITLAETANELRDVAKSHGWSMEGIYIHEVVPAENVLEPEQQYTMFHPSEVEMSTTTQLILSVIDERKPTRVVLDSLSELQLMAENSLRYRRQVLALKGFFSSRSCTVMFLDDRTATNGDLQVRSIAHAVIVLDQTTKDYGAERRRVHVAKYRGVAFRGGMHDYAIVRGGLVVYPRLVASDTRVLGERKQVTTSLTELDQLLGGGLEEGSSTLVAGPPGTGKSTLAAQFAFSAMQRGEKAAMFLFEESANQLLNRMDGFNMGLRTCVDSGQLVIRQIDPAELSPGEFADQVCQAALNGARVIVIDSMNGYLNAMPDERFLTTHLHELLTFLGQKGVITILVGVQSGMLGASMTTSVDASYLADNVIMLRYFESNAEVRQAISVFKKRASAHERTIRQFEITRQGIQIGEPLRGFHGILTGVPTYIGEALSGASLAGTADD